jgi:prepilin-type N-terminal cleavage/methylation domain-containing protein/prepilin-type processing-associated H-X9-DG protein
MGTHSQKTRNAWAFTIVELMVVIAVIGILASLLLPALGRAKDKGRQAFCRNNLKQLALAMVMYQGDNKDQFPTPGSSSKYGPQDADWIWWHYGREISNSSLARYVSEFNPRLFTCPADSVARDLQTKGMLPSDPYRYSYTLTSYDLEENLLDDKKFNLGMASIITLDKKVYPFYVSQVRNPVGKLMFVEEDRETIDDSRWVPSGVKTNKVSPRHASKGVVAFADGHIEAVTPEFGLNLTNSTPRL